MEACDGQDEHRAGTDADCRFHEIGVICEALCVRPPGFCLRTPAATRSRWLIRLLPRGRRCQCLLDAGSRELTSTAALDGVEPGGRTAPFWRSSRWAPAGGARDWRPAREASLPAHSSSPALTCIIGARRAWIALMISSVLIPWRYTLVVDTYEWPSWRWITGRGTPSRASSTA
jgi:hypothetical protein